jgi:myo-inositol-1(or 4)-monophosphatase
MMTPANEQMCASLLTTATEAARAGAEVLMAMYGRTTMRAKGHGNPVTEADIESQRVVIDVLRRAYPEHGIVGEEGDVDTSHAAEYVWYVDPLDGTANYARGIPHFAVSIGCARAGDMLVGVICDPSRNELFSAVKGQGAQLNGDAIAVSDCRGLDQAVVSTGFYYDRGPLIRSTLAAIQRLYEAGLADIRRTGSAALDLSWVACGRLQGYFEYDLGPWDKAAGSLIAAQAGAAVRNRDGSPFALGGKGLLVSGPGIIDTLTSVAGYR